MRSMKCVGGLTHGRGLAESIIAKWIACTVAMIEVCKNMESFCCVYFLHLISMSMLESPESQAIPVISKKFEIILRNLIHFQSLKL